MKLSQKTLLILVAVIFFLALLLRLYRLELNTPPLYADETGHYYYSLLINEPGISFLSKIGRIILYGPLSYTWFLGLSTYAARLPSAINGSLICLGVFLFSLAISQKQKARHWAIISLLACLIAAISPWSYMMSRLFSHIPLMLFFVCLHLYLLLKSSSVKTDLLSLVPLFIGTYYYMSMAVVAPFAVALVFLSLFRRLTKEKRKYLLAVSALVTLSLLSLFVFKFDILNPKGRGLDLAIWNDINVTADSNSLRGLARLSSPSLFSFNLPSETLANKLVFNHPISVLNTFSRNYLSFFSFDFLFLKGDPVLRHSTGMVGQFFPLLIPFMLWGAFSFFQKTDKRTRKIILVWLLVSPLPGAITKDGFAYLLRVTPLMLPLSYFSALGLTESLFWFKNKLAKVLYTLIITLLGLYSAYYFYFGYFHVYPFLAAQSYEYGFKEVSAFQVQNPGKMLIIWDDKYPVGHFCFWQKLPSSVCALSNLGKSEYLGGTRVDLPLKDLLFSLPQNENDLDLVLSRYTPDYLVVSAKDLGRFAWDKKGWPVSAKIEYPDRTTAFVIYQINN